MVKLFKLKLSRRKKYPLLVTILFYSLLFSAVSFAGEQENKIKTGGLISFYYFPPSSYYLSSSEETLPDDFRVDSSVYGQWFILDTIGLGFYYIYIIGIGDLKGSDKKYEDVYIKDEKIKLNEIRLSHYFLTINWLALESIDLNHGFIFDCGFLAGYSPVSSYYKRIFSEKKRGKGSSETIHSRRVTGQAAIFEGFIDWKIYSHGLRLSALFIKTDYNKFYDNTKPDASGYGYYFSYRYAFTW